MMVPDTSLSQDAFTYQIWDSYLIENRRYTPDTKQEGWTDRQCDYYMPHKVPLGHNIYLQMTKNHEQLHSIQRVKNHSAFQLS